MAIVAPLPITLLNGTVNDATQVMLDLQAVADQVNANSEVKGASAAVAAALLAGTGATLVGWSGGGTVDARLSQTVSVKDPRFAGGAKGDGTTDDTAAIAAAFTYVKGLSLYYNLVFPPGIYLTTSQFSFFDLINGSFEMQGACFVGGSTGTAYDSVFKVINAENFKIHGAWTVTADSHFTGPTRNPNLYANGAYFTTGTGGAFTPIISYVDVYGLTTQRCANGLKVCEFNSDAHVSEFTFHGFMAPLCPSAATVSGSQAAVTFVGSLLVSNVVTDFSPALSSPVYQSLVVEGSEVNIVGGEVGYYTSTTGGAIRVQPCSSVTYGNQYGSVQIDNCNMETAASLAIISNPRALSSPGSTLSAFAISNSKGYFGTLPTGSIDVVSVQDAVYAGTVAVPDGNLFYYNNGTRTIASINASAAPNCRVVVGKTAFSVASGFPDWMPGVVGGKLVHALELGFSAYSTTGSNSAGTSAIKWTSKASGSYARYAAMLDTSTGNITVPPGGLRTLRFVVTAIVSTANNTGNIYLYDVTGAVIYAYGAIAGGIAIMDVVVPDAVAGRVYAVYLNIPAVAPWNGQTANSLNVYIAN